MSEFKAWVLFFALCFVAVCVVGTFAVLLLRERLKSLKEPFDVWSDE
jgi:hypothetical protein